MRPHKVINLNKNKEFVLIDTSSVKGSRGVESSNYELPELAPASKQAREFDNEYDRVCASL